MNLDKSSGIDLGVSSSLALSLAELRPHLVPAREIEARERRARLSTGSAALDRLLGGGWPTGGISEVRGARGQGRTAVMLGSLAAALRAGHAAALVDFAAAFDPAAAARAGIPLERLLWVRGPVAGAPRAGERGAQGSTTRPLALLTAAETIAKAGGFGLLVLDFGEWAPAVPTAAWLRLRRICAGPGTVVLVVTARSLGNLTGATSVSLAGASPRFFADGPRAPALLTTIEVTPELRHEAHDAAARPRGPAPAPDAPPLALVHQPA